MSQTESLGVVDAGRWVGVAAAMADYLERWLNGDPRLPPLPRGTFAGARRFLDQVLEGIALNRHQRVHADIPVMAGLSNWNIAIGVLTRLPDPPKQSDELEPIINGYVNCLEGIAGGRRSPELEMNTRSLVEFFRGLLRQGNQARQAAFAHAESPVPLR
jgi:hypothetical protein